MSGDLFKARRERARDIYDDRGFSTRKFAKLAGLGSHTEVMRYLNENQPNNKEPKDITTPVLKKFLEAFDISLERFEQTDTEKLVSDLNSMLKSGKNPKKALQLASEYAELAVGIKEKSEALGLLGKAYFELNMHQEARETVKASYELALKGQDQELLYSAINKLLHSLFSTQDYEQCKDLLDRAESIFSGDVKKMGTFMHFRGVLANVVGDYAESKDCFYRAQDLYQVAGDRFLIGRIKINIARHCYHDGELELALQYLESAMNFLQGDTLSINITAVQHLILVKIQLGDIEGALNLIDEQLGQICEHHLEQPELEGKLLLMKTDLTNDIAFAEKALTQNKISPELRYALMDLIAEKSIEFGDRQVALKYYRLVNDTVNPRVPNYKIGRWF